MDPSATPLWVYKNNARGQTIGNTAWGDWTKFFKRGAIQEWGGAWMTTSNNTLKILREMQRGDRVLCWQTDRGKAFGTAIVARIQATPNGEVLYLRREQAFAHPVPILKLRRADHELAQVGAFRPGGGTLFRTTDKEAALLLEACERWQEISERHL